MPSDLYILTALFTTLAVGLVICVLILERTEW